MISPYNHAVLNRICEQVQQEMANKLENNEIEWTVKVEVLFLYAMIGYKPVGVNRYFMMLLIHNRFSTFINHEISSKLLWDHLESMYDMAALHESEIIPFPNDETDFELPEDCHELLQTKYGVSLKKSSENETNKNNANLKNSKKLTPKLKQNNTPVNTPKSTFATPVLNKPTKNQITVKSETKASNNDVASKSKQEVGLSVKPNKVKRASSPLLGKTIKSEPVSIVKENSPDIVSNKKSHKLERGSSPATMKKSIKAETNVTNNSSKKTSKTEISVNGSKPTKTESSDNSQKKIKVDKDVLNKKGKIISSTEIPSKKLKVDVNGIKKKTDENTPKKSSESAPVKQIKTESKSSNQSKGQDADAPPPSGSRKSSPVVKVKSNESSKKLKRHRQEESSKKSLPTPKRRRL